MEGKIRLRRIYHARTSPVVLRPNVTGRRKIFPRSRRQPLERRTPHRRMRRVRRSRANFINRSRNVFLLGAGGRLRGNLEILKRRHRGNRREIPETLYRSRNSSAAKFKTCNRRTRTMPNNRFERRANRLERQSEKSRRSAIL